MKCIVIGAGNAGRPVARILKHQNYDVTMTDSKDFNDFNDNSKSFLKVMEKEGINILFNNKNPDFENYDCAYLAPSISKDSEIYKKISKENIKIITNEEACNMISKFIPIDIIGITGTMGKTTTTYLTDKIFKAAGYETWTCSSLVHNVVSEAIVDGIIDGKAAKSDIAIFELPHGTIGLLKTLPVKIGLLTNLDGDHLKEFDGSIEKYIERKLILEESSEIFIGNNKCRTETSELRDDCLYYGMSEDVESSNFIGTSSKDSLSIKYNVNDEIKGEFKTPFQMKSYFYENAVAGSAIALTYGVSEEDIIKSLSAFNGLPVHMEYFGDYNGRKVILDAAFLEAGMIKTLEYFSEDRIVLFLDHFDTETKRAKKEVGALCGKYADVIIASAYNEETKAVEIEAAQELLDGIENPNVTKVLAENITEAAELTLKYSNPGDLILHMGPAIAYLRIPTTRKIKEGLESGIKKYN